MTKQNLEQKIGLMDTFRGIARRTVGIYTIASALTFGGMVLGGCEMEMGDGPDYCSYTVDDKVKSGCPPGEYCEASYGKNETRITGHHCVSD
ncbi:MAG: hypothetical protein AABY26_02055 [Nanoarchaeota archaeon]